MRANIRSFVAAAAESFPTAGTVYEFGSYIVPGQEQVGDLRALFPGRKYVGCDMRAGPGVDRIEDLGNLTLPDDSAATIVCVETLEHVFEVRRAADELMRVLAPGGLLFISTPLNFKLHNHPDDYWRITPSCLQGLLAPLAATLVGWQGVDSFPHTVFAVACKAPVPTWFTAGVGRFTGSFQQRLREVEAAQPWSKKWHRRVTSWIGTKRERRRMASYYETQWLASYAMTQQSTKAGLRTLQSAGIDLEKAA